VAAAQGTEAAATTYPIRVQEGRKFNRPDVPVTLDAAAVKFNVGGPVLSGVCGEPC